ncbi:MAG: hypothetical protein ACRDZT_04995, partial [Acidimicrobiales bacterium]
VLAETAGATGEVAYKEAAERIMVVLLTELRRSDGRVLRSLRAGEGQILGFSADVAWLLEACVRLFELTGQRRYLEEADALASQLLSVFVDGETGGLFTTGSDGERLVVRPRELFDNVIPAASSVAAVAMARLGAILGRSDLEEAAHRLVAAGGAGILRAPTAVPELLWASHLAASGPLEIAVTPGAEDVMWAMRCQFLPSAVFVWSETSGDQVGEGPPLPLLAGREAGKVYVCRSGTCRLPASDLEGAMREVAAAVGSPQHSPD